MQITNVLKPKTSEGSRPGVREEHQEFVNQTLDKYQFANNSATRFYYRQYYGAANGKTSSKTASRSSTRMDGTRALTSQSTKNTSRMNPELLCSFLQTEGVCAQERTKPQQSSSLMRFFRRRDVRSPYSQISEEDGEKKSEIGKDRGLTETIKAVCYEKRRTDRNKFYLPAAPIYSKRTVYSKKLGVVKDNAEDLEKVKMAQERFICGKLFDDSDPYRVSFEDLGGCKEKGSTDLERRFVKILNLAQRNQTSEILGKGDLFGKDSGFARSFKVNSIIHRSLCETPKSEVLTTQIRSKFLEQKNLAKTSEFKRYFLFVENLYLDEGKKSKLKYCYSAINLVCLIDIEKNHKNLLSQRKYGLKRR